jgi:DNA-binding MarR family transcriptional regulator
MEESRDDLLQTLAERFASVMKLVRHPTAPPGPPPFSPPQANVFFTIAHHPEGISVKELAEHSGVTPGAITQFVDGLVEKGLVLREGDPADRRVVRLKTTELAMKQLEKFRQEHLVAFCRVFEVLDNNELSNLISLLDKIESSEILKDK